MIKEKLLTNYSFNYAIILPNSCRNLIFSTCNPHKGLIFYYPQLILTRVLLDTNLSHLAPFSIYLFAACGTVCPYFHIISTAAFQLINGPCRLLLWAYQIGFLPFVHLLVISDRDLITAGIYLFPRDFHRMLLFTH